MKREVLYGGHAVAEALAAARRQIFEVLLDESKRSRRTEAIAALAEKRNLPASRVSPQRLASVTGTGYHQGVAAVVGSLPLLSLGELMKPSTAAQGPLLLLDAIEDPRNFGALVRTALCSGVQGVVIPKDRCARPVPTVSRASAGALEHTRLASVANMVNAIRRLREEGYWICGMDAGEGTDLYRQDLTGRLAILVGGEDRGLRNLLKKNCDFLLRIPQQGPVTSLNASVAGALVMYEALRQRRQERI